MSFKKKKKKKKRCWGLPFIFKKEKDFGGVSSASGEVQRHWS
jgi:hypothetical protein